MKDLNKLAQTLKDRRIELNLSINDVFSKTGIPKNYLAGLEKAQYQTISTHAIWKLSELYEEDFKSLCLLAGIIVPK